MGLAVCQQLHRKVVLQDTQKVLHHHHYLSLLQLSTVRVTAGRYRSTLMDPLSALNWIRGCSGECLTMKYVPTAAAQAAIEAYTQAQILAYGSSTPLTLDGQCLCEIQHHNGVSRYLRFFVLAGNAELILGLSAYEQFSLIRRLCCKDLNDVPISPEIPPPQVHQNVAVEDPFGS